MEMAAEEGSDNSNYFSKQTLFGASILIYITYYTIKVVHHPRVYANVAVKKFLMVNCPVLREKFWPTFWCYGARPQTIIRSIFKSYPVIMYRKEFITFPDGGHAALDWTVDNDTLDRKETLNRPTVIFLPGLTGTSQESYILHLVEQASIFGYRSVVFNNRGNGGAELKTPRTYCASNTEDLAEVVAHVKRLYPDSPLLAAGVSLGGIILTNYVAKMGNSSGLLATFTMSAAWDCFETTKTLENNTVNYYLFNNILCKALTSLVGKYRHMFEDDYEVDHIMNSSTIRDFDERFIAKQFGYKSWKEYYDDSNLHGKVNVIKTPLLSVNAADDPFAPGHSLPLDDISKSKYVALVLTKHGGHIGFLEGILPRHASYVDRIFAQYINAVINNKDQINDMINM